MLAFPSPKWQTAMLATKINATSYAGLKLGTASRITPNLFLSDYFTARDEKELRTHGITHVVSVIEDDPEIPSCIPEENKLWLTLADRPSADILSHLDDTTAFITEALQDPSNKVLIHCFQGISRSATVLCAYLVSTGMRVDNAIKFVQEKRGIVRPNIGFVRQLDTYAKKYAHLCPPKEDNIFVKSIRKMKMTH